MANLKSLDAPETVQPNDARRIGEYKWPAAMNLKTAAEYLNISYQTAYGNGLFNKLEALGIMWSIPGTGIKRVVRAKLDEWIEVTRKEQNGELAS